MTETPDLRCFCCGDIVHPDVPQFTENQIFCGPCSVAESPASPAMPKELTDTLDEIRGALGDTDRRWAWGLAARYHGTGGTTEEFRACVRELGEQLLADLLAAREPRMRRRPHEQH